MDNLRMSKRWVYRELVKGQDDTQGFLAYSLYKFEKNEFAEGLRVNGMDEESIVTELDTFHRQTVNTPARIEGYREKAKIIIANIFDQLEVQIRYGYEVQLDGANEQANKIERLTNEIDQLKSAHEQELIEAREAAILHFYRTVAIQYGNKQNRFLRVMQWLWNGFAGVFAAILFAVLIYGLCTLFLPKQARDDVVNGAINNIKNTLFQQPNVILNDGIDHIKHINPPDLHGK
ncbi:hypothetical protein PROVRUST_06365 [Providencia rustigianii DSM 4541]|uniref:Uncharacterized protein n=4 Tax=Providencia rustigianii TaxID=158850 RepID=D1P2E1_9GAMM|nr:hypothetical protein [Providencia rustigianii]EFB72296.1 hypothetical protein PROVRUST_06365 [Providencia rustigianii DSM 4541]